MNEEDFGLHRQKKPNIRDGQLVEEEEDEGDAMIANEFSSEEGAGDECKQI